MNRKLLALAIGAAFALPMAAQAAPTVYGKLDVSVESLDGEYGSGTANEAEILSVESNTSRIGVRGEEKLNDTLSAIYQVEWGVNVDGDSSNSPDLSQRDRYLGLQHASMGTLRVGQMNTPLKDAEGKVDVFNDTRLDMKNVFAGQEREPNSIAYTSPKIADLATARVTAMTEEGNGGTGGSVSASLTFENDTFYLAVAVDNDVIGDFDAGRLNEANPGMLSGLFGFYGVNGVETDTTRVVGAIDLSGFKLGALYQQSEVEGNGTTQEQTGLLVSAAYTMDKWTFKGEMATSEAEMGTADLGEITQIAFGVDYQWTQTFKTYGLLGTIEYDNGNTISNDDPEVGLFGVGMALAF